MRNEPGMDMIIMGWDTIGVQAARVLRIRMAAAHAEWPIV